MIIKMLKVQKNSTYMKDENVVQIFFATWKGKKKTDSGQKVSIRCIGMNFLSSLKLIIKVNVLQPCHFYSWN